MRYIRERVNEEGNVMRCEVETSSAHEVLERLGFVSEVEMERKKKAAENLERMKQALCKGCQKSLALCMCVTEQKTTTTARIASGKGFCGYKKQDGTFGVRKYFGQAHMQKIQTAPGVVVVTGPFHTEEQAKESVAS